MENYFILRINYDKPSYYLNILFLLTRCLPIYKINWIKTNEIRTFSYVKKFNNKFSSFETKSMVKDFLYSSIYSRLLNSSIFVSVGTLMDGMMKNVMILDTLMKFLNLSVFACKRSVIANTLMYFQITITLEEIQNTVLDMKNNKAPDPDGIPIEYFKAFFSKSDLSDNQDDSSVVHYSDCAKCLLSLYNKIWDGDFPEE